MADREKKELVNVWLRVQPEEKTKIQENAKLARMSVSRYMMTLVDNKPIFVIKDFAKFIIQLHRMNGNVNQIAKVVNSQKYADYPMRKVLRDNQNELNELAKSVNKILLHINCPTERTISEKEAELVDMLERIEELSKTVKGKIKVGG